MVDGLELQQNAVVDDKIESMDVNRPPPIADRDALLPLESNAVIRQLIADGSMIGGLNQTRTQLAVNENAATDGSWISRSMSGASGVGTLMVIVLTSNLSVNPFVFVPSCLRGFPSVVSSWPVYRLRASSPTRSSRHSPETPPHPDQF